ncbi:MAG: DUF1127 domain-containing protein [Burkholderiales bacterium]
MNALSINRSAGAQQATAAALARTGATLIAALRSLAAGIDARIRARRDFRQTVAELNAMDDRLLRDIGLARWQVECYADTGRLDRQA